MATFYTFVCTNCDFRIRTASSHTYAIMTGMYATYLCKNCKIVFRSKTNPTLVVCPTCGKTNIQKWDPISCRCPKCDHKLEATLKRFALVD